MKIGKNSSTTETKREARRPDRGTIATYIIMALGLAMWAYDLTALMLLHH